MKKVLLLILILLPICISATELNCNQDIDLCINNPINLTSGYIQCTNFFNNGHSTNIKLILDSNSDNYCATFSESSMGIIHETEIICETFFLEDSLIPHLETFNYSFSCPEPVCGNEILEDFEECDLGEESIACIAGYSEFCSYCSNDCLNVSVIGGFCGDNICQEEFENWTSCNIDCEKPSICGDGILDFGEECDGTNCCTSTCTIKEHKDKTRSSITKYEMKNDCNPNWECSSWGECIGDIKSRVCFDVNNCEYSYNMPPETVGCEVVSMSLIEDDTFNLIPLVYSFLTLLLVLFLLVRKYEN